MNKRFLVVLFLAFIMALVVFADDGDAEAKKPDFTDSVRDAASAAGQNIRDATSTGADKVKEILNDAVARVTGDATTVSMVAAVAIGAALLA